MSSRRESSTFNGKVYSFRFKKIPSYKSLEQSYCSCCMLSFKRVYPDDQVEEGLRPIVCYGCLQISHKYCYGLSTPVKDEDGIEYFVCDSCATDHKHAPTCNVCKNTGGLMRSLKDDGFIHPVCGLTHPEINVSNYSTLDFKKAAFYTDSYASCQVCSKQNAYFKCSEQKCEKRVHPLCVMKSFRQKEQTLPEGEEIKNCWKFFMSPGESKLYSGVEQEHSLDKEINDFVSQNKDNRINSELVRGGFQYVLCPQHSQNVFYCNCGKEIEDMVFCDCCLEWYHTACTNYKGGQDEEGEEKFICPFCISWGQLKAKILKEIKSDKIQNYELKLTQNPKLYLPDFILMAIVCELRLSKLTESGGNTSRILKIIDFYPLKLFKQSPVQKVMQNSNQNTTSFQEIQYWITSNKDNKEIEMVGNKHVDDLWDGIEVDQRNSEKYIKTRINYLTTWTNIIKNELQGVTLSFSKVKGLLYEYYEILKKYMMVSHTIIKTLKEPITFLEGVFQKLIPVIQRLNKANSLAEIEDESEVMGSLDISEIIIEAKVFLSTKKLLQLDIKLRKPYADLNRFYQDYRRVTQNLQDERIIYADEKKDELKKLPPFSTQTSEKDRYLDLKKKLRTETNTSMKPVQTKKVEKTAPNIVTQEDRISINKILTNRMLQNKEFNSIKADEFVKIIQNQIFGEFHKNRNKYLTLSQSFEMVFIILEECPLISVKAKKKNFEYIFMKELVDNTSKIKDIEEKLKIKQKDQVAKEKESRVEIKEIVPVVTPKNDVLKSIFAGKIEGKMEKELEEIYALKKDADKERRLKNGSSKYDKYDKYDRHDDRSRRKYDSSSKRERSNSRERTKRKRSNSKERAAKFSDDESPEVPYEGYNPLAGPDEREKDKDFDDKDKDKDFLDREFEGHNPGTIEPILYDPEEDEKEVEEKEKQIERGTIIKLKTCQIEAYVNREKKVFTGSMYTLEDNRKIKELCDPNFQKLSIRKDKPQGEILEYLSKVNRKKYRYLIGWLESERVRDNQYLRDLAIECEQKYRVYGLQNSLAKLHIMSSRQLNKQMINKFRAPGKVTTEQVSHYLGEHRMVFVLQISVEKLYEMKATSSMFNVQPIFTSADVASEPIYDTGMSHNLPPEMMYGVEQIISNVPHIPIASMNPRIPVPPKNIIDHTNEVVIDTWDAEPVAPPVFKRKPFSPITSDDQGQNDREKFTKSDKFDIMDLIGQLDETAASKLASIQPTSYQPSHHLPPTPAYVPPQAQRTQHSSYLYQQQRPSNHGNPMMVSNALTQRTMGMPMQPPQSTYPHQSGYNTHNTHNNPNQMRGQNNMMPQQRYMGPNQNYYPGYPPPPPNQYRSHE